MSEKLYQLREHSFQMDQYPNCCGIDVATGFYVDETTEEEYKKQLAEFNKEYKNASNWWRPDPPAKPLKLAAVHKWYEKKIRDRRAAARVQLALITKYKSTGKEQVPGLSEYLQKKGYEVQQVFINPAHGNEITILQKTWKNRNLKNW